MIPPSSTILFLKSFTNLRAVLINHGEAKVKEKFAEKVYDESLKWAEKHGIPTDNGTIYLIRRAISRDGIAPRPFMDKVFDDIDYAWDKDWADELFDELTRLITEYFND